MSDDDRRHFFEITVRGRGADDIGPDGEPGYWSDAALMTQTVRAWNLHDALVAASKLPLWTWFEPEEDPK